MQFTASDGKVINEYELQNEISEIILSLKQDDFVVVVSWELEFLKWYLDKEVEPEKFEEEYENFLIRLHKHITEDELKQFEQFINFLEL